VSPLYRLAAAVEMEFGEVSLACCLGLGSSKRAAAGKLNEAGDAEPAEGRDQRHGGQAWKRVKRLRESIAGLVQDSNGGAGAAAAVNGDGKSNGLVTVMISRHWHDRPAAAGGASLWKTSSARWASPAPARSRAAPPREPSRQSSSRLTRRCRGIPRTPQPQERRPSLRFSLVRLTRCSYPVLRQYSTST
jgi:hypothetical protein